VHGPGAGSWLLPAGLATGSLMALGFTDMPPLWLLCVLAATGLLAVVLTPLRWLGAMVLACCWSLWCFHLRLSDRLPAALAGEVVTVSGIISSIPQDYGDYVSFRFEPVPHELTGQVTPKLPRTLLLRWYTDWPPLGVGQRWRFELLLKPPWGAVNFQGPDREKWLFASGIGGVATVRGGTLEAAGRAGGRRVTMLREAVFHRIAADLQSPRQAGIIQALAVAERSGMSYADRQLLALTGTTHLLAISGLHIGLAAAGGVLLSRALGWFLPVLPAGRGLHLLAIGGGSLAACAYAAMAGFGVATLRSLLMLLVAMTAVSASRSIHPGRAWLLALAAVLLLDPFAPMGAGFWFSFLAVGVLLWTFVPRPGHYRWWKSLLMAQGAVMLSLMPVSAAWFQAASAVGLIANLVAIPMVSFLIVPPVLAGLAALAVSPQLAGLAWSVAGFTAGLLLQFLEFMATIQSELVVLNARSLTGTLLAIAGAGLLLLPRGLPGRWSGLFLLAPLVLPPSDSPAEGAMEVEVLDAGQGTAVLLRTGAHMLLYDSGPGDGRGRDMVPTVVVPAVNRGGRRSPDRIIISHGDLDHAGGLESLLKRYPQALFYGNLPHPVDGVAACQAPLAWRWHDNAFTVLHPSAGLPYQGNDSSCVLQVEQGGWRILFGGDISTTIETRLLFEGLDRSRLLVVPHHGSRTSSSRAFVGAVAPDIAVATAALGNRFGFPKAEIRQRYEDLGAVFWSTGECGALRIATGPEGRMTATSARLSRPAIWRWPAAAGCPLRTTVP